MEAGQFLQALRSRLRVVLTADALARSIRLLVLSFAVVVLLDFTAPLPSVLRLLIGLAVLFALGVMIWHRLWRPLNHVMDDAALAQVVERRVAECNGLLLSWVDGVALDAADQGRLKSCLHRDQLLRLVRADGALRRSLAAGMLVLGLVAMTWANPQTMSTAWQRILAPFGNAQWPRSVALAASLERSVVAEDEPFVLNIERLRGSSGSIRVQWEGEDAQSEQRILGAMRGPWRELLQLSPSDYRIRISGGDALPQVVEGRVVVRPQAVLTEARIVAPAYLNREPITLSTLSGATVVPGSSLEAVFALRRSSHRVDETLAIYFADKAIDYQLGEDELRFSLPILDNGELHLALVDIHRGLIDGIEQEIKIAARPPLRLPVVVSEDRPPHVELHGPRPGESVTPRVILSTRIDATDDYGLADLSLKGRVLPADTVSAGSDSSGDDKHGAEEGHETSVVPEQLLHAFEGVDGSLTTSRSHQLGIAHLVTIGDRIELIAEARDHNDVSGPGVGRSQPRLLRVVSEDDLHRELDQQLVEIRDRLMQARESLSRGLADPEALTDAARGANSIARRGSDQLADVGRRWADNQLDDQRLQQLHSASAVVDEQALPEVQSAAVPGQDAAMAHAREGDAALGRAVDMVSAMLQSDDLLRDLDSLIRRQEGMVSESRKLVLQALTAALPDADAEHAQNLSQRQDELAQQLRAIERRLLESSATNQQGARAVVEDQQPADLLSRAARGLDDERPGQQVVRQQDQALQAMRAMRDALQGQDAAKQLAAELGRLATQQEALTQAMAEGADPRSLSEKQADLRRQAAELATRLDELSAADEAAREAMDAAEAAQEQAQEAMDGGQQSSAMRESSAASAQLRAAQRALEGGDQEGDNGDAIESDEEEDPPKPDILALLRELITKQTTVVTRATVVHRSLQRAHEEAGHVGDYRELDWSGQRDVQDLARQQSDIQLRLLEEGLKELDNHPIAQRALTRVVQAVDAALAHFDQPALGERGLRLPKIALFEMQRLLQIAENLPTPAANDEEGQEQEQGEGEGGGDQPPFPPAAEIALLRAEQERIAWQTRTRQPGDLAQQQSEVADLTEFLLSNSRPGSRAQILLERARRAMLSAGQRLGDGNDRGPLTMSEQDVALASLSQLLNEAQQSGSGGSSSSQQPSSANAGQAGQSGQSEADGSGGSEGGGNSSGGAAAAAEGEGESGTVTAVINEAERGAFLQYAPAVRPRLIEAMNDPSLPADARALLRRYFELLER